MKSGRLVVSSNQHSNIKLYLQVGGISEEPSPCRRLCVLGSFMVLWVYFWSQTPHLQAYKIMAETPLREVMCIQQCVWCYVVKFRPHSTAHLQTFQNRSNHSLGCVLGRVGGATGQILVMLVSSQGTQRSTAKLKHKCGNKGSCNAFPSRTSGDATADFSTVTTLCHRRSQTCGITTPNTHGSVTLSSNMSTWTYIASGQWGGFSILWPPDRNVSTSQLGMFCNEVVVVNIEINNSNNKNKNKNNNNRN